MLAGLEPALAVFRPEDFDDAHSALNDVESPEARGTVKLFLCRQILNGVSRRPVDKSKISPEKQQPENPNPNKPESQRKKELNCPRDQVADLARRSPAQSPGPGSLKLWPFGRRQRSVFDYIKAGRPVARDQSHFQEFE